MKNKINIIKKYPNLFLWVGIGISIIFWALESWLHVSAIDDGDLLSQLFHPSIHEIWMRGLVLGCLIGFSIIIQRKFNKINKLNDELRLNHYWQDLILNNINDSIWTINLFDLRFSYISSSAQKIIGYTSEELLAIDLKMILTPDSYKHVMNILEEELLKETVVNSDPNRYRVIEIQHIAKDGNIVWVEINASFLRDRNGKPIQILGITRDITDRKQTEEDLRISEEKFSKAFNANPVLMSISTLHDGRFIEVNKGFTRLSEYSRDEVIGRTSVELNLWADASDRNKMSQQIMNEGRIHDMELFFKTKSGRKLTVLLSGEMIEIGGEKCIVTLAEDITERKQVAEALKASERNYSEIFNNVNDAIFVHDKTTGDILDVNQAVCDMFGYAYNELLELKVQDLSYGIPPYSQAEAEQKIMLAIKEGPQLFEWQAKRKNGELFWVETNLKQVVIGGQEKILAVVRDISTQKKAEFALKESEERFRSTFEQAAVGIAHVATDGTFMRLNSRFCDIIGYTQNEISKLSFQDITHKDDLGKDLVYMKQLLANQMPTYSTEKRYYRKDGSIVWVYLTVSLLRDESGDPKHFISVIEDITAKKYIEQALKESEEKYRMLVENSLQSIIIMQDNKIVFANRLAEQLTGYSIKELVSMSKMETQHIIHPEDQPLVYQRLKDRLDGKNVPQNYEFRIIHKTGLIRWVETYAGIIDYMGKPATLGTYIDITDRIIATNELRAEQEKLKNVVANIGEAMIIINQDFEVEFQNNMFKQRFGNAINKKCHDVVMGKEMPAELCPMHKAVYTGSIQYAEFVALDNKETEITVSPFIDSNGETKVIVLIKDISEKKQMEKEAMRSAHLVSMGELAAGVAHEINNPINSIIMYAEVIKDKINLESNYSEFPEFIIKEGIRIADIVRNLLSFARQSENEKNAIDIYEALNETMMLLAPTLKKDGIKLELSMPSADKIFIMGNKNQIQQVVINMISNARFALNKKYTRPHKDKLLEIKGELQKYGERKMFLLTFHDHGSGMPPQIANRVLEPFFTTKPKGEGTGLGLSISHGIITDHNGELQIESKEGEYTKVKVKLPVN